MDDIRNAHLAEANALETILATLASKQQASMTALRREVEKIAAEQARIAAAATGAGEGRGRNLSGSLGSLTEAALGGDGASCRPRSARGSEVGSDNAAGKVSMVNVSSAAECTDQGVETVETARSGTNEDEQLEQDKGWFEDTQQKEDLTFLTHRVATLEKDMMALQGMWDMNKGHRIVEVWMSLLNKKSYKPKDCDDPLECAAITLQNWWRDMLVTKLDWCSSSDGDVSGVSESGSGNGKKDEDMSSTSLEGIQDKTRPVTPPEFKSTNFPVVAVTDGDYSASSTAAALSVTGVEAAEEAPYAEPPAAQNYSESVAGEQTGSASDGQDDGPSPKIERESSEGSSFSQKMANNAGGSVDDAETKLVVGEASAAAPTIIETPVQPTTSCDKWEHSDSTASSKKLDNHSKNNSNINNNNNHSSNSNGNDDSLNNNNTNNNISNNSIRNDGNRSNSNKRQKRGKQAAAAAASLPKAPAVEGTSSMEEARVRPNLNDISWPSPDRNAGGSDISPSRSKTATTGGGSPQHRVRRHKRGSNEHHSTGHVGSDGIGGGSVQGMFDGAMAGNPVLMITSMAMQLQSLETEVDNLRQSMESIEGSISGITPQGGTQQSAAVNKQDDSIRGDERAEDAKRPQPTTQSYTSQGITAEEFSEMGRHMGQLQRELQSIKDREEDRERRTELSLEAIEALITSKDEDVERRFQEQAEGNANNISRLLEKLGAQEAQDKSGIIRPLLVELKLELRSLYSSLAAIMGNEVSATLLRGLEGIYHLLLSLAEKAKELEEEIGDPAKLARSMVADDIVARRFADVATDLGTALFAFIKAQVLQARRARDGRVAPPPHRRTSSPDAATAIVAKVSDVGTAADVGGSSADEGDGVGPSNTTSAPPQAWAKLSSLTYTRDGTGENTPFPAGLVRLLKALSDVLNHCVGTGDLAIRLSVTLEDLMLYVAQRCDKDRESVARQLATPVEDVRTKLSEMEETLAGFQRTMHLVLTEVDADKERSNTIQALGAAVEEMQTLFSRVRGELQSKAGASDIEAALQDMTSKINESANRQSQLQRLARTLGKDQNSSAVMKRLQIELEQARSQTFMAMAPHNNDVLIGAKCLSCNRPLGGFTPPPLPKSFEEWYPNAGTLSGPRDRVMELTSSSGGGRAGGRGEQDSGDRAGGGGAGGGNGIGTSKSPGQTQPVITPGKIIATVDGPGTASGTVSRMKGAQGPLLFERTGGGVTGGGDAVHSVQGLKGRVLRGSGGPGTTEGNVSISKYPRLVPLTAPKSAPATDKLYTTSSSRVTTTAPSRR